VGDFFQGVYGFNAADDKSFEWFEKFQNTKVLPLSVSFRCAKNIIIKAQEIVPDIKALEDAPDGIVRDGDVFEAQSGDFILCRTTMPLVKLFFEFLVRQKKAIIKGRDIGLQLIDLIGKINTIEKLKSFWNNELSKFRKDLKAEGVLNPNEHSGYSTLEDKVMTLLFLAKLADNIPDLKLKISTIFTDDIQGICLSTVHKIKGLEANRVFIIRPDLLPMKNVKSWQYIQEKNLEYVAITRAKLELIYDKTWTDES
jgi:DNA helicase-2/ATP-dependent DNA helicase PcrA